MEKKQYHSSTKMIHEKIQSISFYSLEGTIDEAIQQLQEYKNNFSHLPGTVKLSVEKEYAYGDNEGQELFVLINIRPETTEETKERLKENKIINLKIREQKKKQLEQLKKELGET